MKASGGQPVPPEPGSHPCLHTPCLHTPSGFACSKTNVCHGANVRGAEVENAVWHLHLTAVAPVEVEVSDSMGGGRVRECFLELTASRAIYDQ